VRSIGAYEQQVRRSGREEKEPAAGVGLGAGWEAGDRRQLPDDDHVTHARVPDPPSHRPGVVPP
jgi:hypothetical protein